MLERGYCGSNAYTQSCSTSFEAQEISPCIMLQDGTCREPMCYGTASSSAAQQVDQRMAVVDSPHTNIYVLYWMSTAIPLFAVMF